MGNTAEELARIIGARVRQERRALGWTLDALAHAAEVSRRMVVNVEQGTVNPSIGTLLRLSDALGVGLPALVEPPAMRGTKVTRNGEGAVLWTGERGGSGVLMLGTDSPDVVELWEWTLIPGERHVSEPHSRGTRELLYVLSGAITVTTEGGVHELGIGDALSFPGDVAHEYENLSDTPAKFSLTVFEPGVGATHRRERAGE